LGAFDSGRASGNKHHAMQIVHHPNNARFSGSTLFVSQA
jgi:hypothetical protein